MGKEGAKRTGRQSKKSGRRLGQQASGSPLSSRLATEKLMLDVHRVMQGQEFQTIEEANAFLATLAGPGLKEALKKAPAFSSQEEAQELAYRAMEATTRTQALPLAQQALAKDPDCVDALVTVAEAVHAVSRISLLVWRKPSRPANVRSEPNASKRTRAIFGAFRKRGLPCAPASSCPTYCWTPGA